MLHCAFEKAFLFLIQFSVLSWLDLTGPQVPVMQRNSTGSADVPAAENLLFPQQPLSLAHDSSPPWQLCSSIFQEERRISPSLERRMGTVCRGGTSWAWILLLQMHNFGPAHIICVSAGVSSHCSTWCTLNTNCFLLLPEYFTYWYSVSFENQEHGELCF